MTEIVKLNVRISDRLQACQELELIRDLVQKGEIDSFCMVCVLPDLNQTGQILYNAPEYTIPLLGELAILEDRVKACSVVIPDLEET